MRSVSEMGATVCLAIGDAAAERYLSDKRNSIKLAGVVGHSNKVEARVRLCGAGEVVSLLMCRASATVLGVHCANLPR